jgi:hypothetical protein
MSSGVRSLATCLQDHRCCRCSTLVAPSPLVCRPLRFAKPLSRRLHLLSRYCAPLVHLVVMLPGGLPPPLSQRPSLSSCLSICWLSRRVASRHIVWRLVLPSPSHHASASRSAPLVWLVVALCCLAPRPLSPSYPRACNAAVVVIDIVAVGSSGGIITNAVAVATAVSAIAVVAVIVNFEGREGGAGSRSSFERGGG